MASQILASTSDLIFESLHSKLSSSIEKGLKSGINMNSQTSQLQIKLLNTINSLCFDTLVCPATSILAETHFSLPDQSDRTMYDENIGKQFFSKYTDFDLAHQSRIIFGISHSSQDRKQLIYRYYRKLRMKVFQNLLTQILNFPGRRSCQYLPSTMWLKLSGERKAR